MRRQPQRSVGRRHRSVRRRCGGVRQRRGDGSRAARAEGGGIAAQADAVRHAIARAIIKAEPKTRKVLKAAKLLMRDPRAKERKKPGLVKARKRKQWSKR